MVSGGREGGMKGTREGGGLMGSVRMKNARRYLAGKEGGREGGKEKF